MYQMSAGEYDKFLHDTTGRAYNAIRSNPEAFTAHTFDKFIRELIVHGIPAPTILETLKAATDLAQQNWEEVLSATQGLVTAAEARREQEQYVDLLVEFQVNDMVSGIYDELLPAIESGKITSEEAKGMVAHALRGISERADSLVANRLAARSGTPAPSAE